MKRRSSMPLHLHWAPPMKQETARFNFYQHEKTNSTYATQVHVATTQKLVRAGYACGREPAVAAGGDGSRPSGRFSPKRPRKTADTAGSAAQYRTATPGKF